MAVQGKWENTELLSSSDEDLKIYCQPCDHDGPRMPAFGFCTDCREHLCETCFNLHKRHTLSRDHILLEKSNMPQTFISATGSQAETLTTSCSHHQKEMIKFFCHDHKALLCHVCITMDHPRTSCKVNYIPEISASIIDSKEYQDILKAIEDVSKDFDSKFEYLKKMIEKSDKSLTDAMADLRKFRIEINERLDKLESETETIAKAIQQETSLNLEKFKTKCEEVTKSLTPWLDTIPHLNKQMQADRLFMQIKLAEQMIQDYKETILQIAANDVKQYKFEPNKDLKSLLHEEKFLGSWETKQVRPQRPSKAPCRANPGRVQMLVKFALKHSKINQFAL
ncbi:E3 ubiquitin-protein ligase TRIM33-like [Ruditapes philippinarum]|uniref:E3 ubiquitin-protein ligase TRIM33-like n=1 Tax=Ruditapes philippinarum TaxID=129788 RepID=UPI00295B965F|nr:E3 ubiquitin-protein ligase TRIM33-like [Ruditapes philippinarum]